MMTQSESSEDLGAAVSAKTARKARGSFLLGFGQRIVAGRIRKGWTRIELAGELGISRERLAKWERGQSAPPLRMLVALQRALGGTLEELIKGERPSTRFLSPAQRVEAEQHLEALKRLLNQVKPVPDWTTGEDAQGEKL